MKMMPLLRRHCWRYFSPRRSHSGRLRTPTQTATTRRREDRYALGKQAQHGWHRPHDPVHFGPKEGGEADRILRVTTYRRDSADTYTILFQDPDSEKGKGYLRKGNDLYFYLPSTREFVYRNRKDNIGSTDARTDLFGRQKTHEQYWVDMSGSAKVSVWDCDVVRLDARPRTSLPDPEMVRAQKRRAPGEGGKLLRLGDPPGDLLIHRVQGLGARKMGLHQTARC